MREVHGGLAGAVGTADDVDVLILATGCFCGCRAIVDASTGEAVHTICQSQDVIGIVGAQLDALPRGENLDAEFAGLCNCQASGTSAADDQIVSLCVCFGVKLKLAGQRLGVWTVCAASVGKHDEE